MEDVEKSLGKYLHKHTTLVTTLVVLTFFLLATGEYYLYRQMSKINAMVSEGLMQLKEEKQIAPSENLRMMNEELPRY